MARYEIVVTNEDTESTWEAAIFPMDDDGHSGDCVASAGGDTRLGAVVGALAQWTEAED